ncbi:MAG: ribose 5-phosphate isomerase B [Chloroflexi bacterium]|nr:ribose 5-phosphate isomerase B [Chloroflexota bacterium]
MSIAIGSDEAGFHLKEVLRAFLVELGHQVDDYGCFSAGAVDCAVDYPDVAEQVALAIAAGRHARAVLVCGTGIGMAITANKVPGVRAAQAHDTYSAERARKSNDAQILALGARVVGPELAKSIVRVWLDAEFGGEASPSYRKVRKIITIDRRYRELAGASRA